MTDIIIVHSKIGDATNHWYKWLANNLILEGYNVTLFDLPVEENDNLEQWVERMKDQITVKKYETYFITHGFGTLASLKYIEEMNINHIEGLFSVAGFMDDAEEIGAYIDPETKAIDYEIVKNKVDQFYGLCSKNDEYVSYLETKRLMDTLNGVCKVTESGGHFIEDDGFTTFTILHGKMQGIMSK